MIRKIAFFAFIIFTALVFGQKKEQLQKQNADLKKQIAAINADLAKARNESKLSVSYLENVNKKIPKFSFSISSIREVRNPILPRKSG